MRPRRRATSTTRTPNCKLSATIRAFRSTGHRRFPRRGSTTSQRPINPSPPSAISNLRSFPETFSQTHHQSEIRTINEAGTALTLRLISRRPSQAGRGRRAPFLGAWQAGASALVPGTDRGQVWAMHPDQRFSHETIYAQPRCGLKAAMIRALRHRIQAR
jgi:hypothetical protein